MMTWENDEQMALHKCQIVVVVLLCALGLTALVLVENKPSSKLKQSAHSRSEQSANKPEAWALPASNSNDARNYKAAVAKLEVERVALALRYQQAGSAAERAEVIAQARIVVTRSIYSEVFPSWYGTPWDFNGTTETPQDGKIACGYFVSTVLRDAGWRVQRMRLAQQASENIILSLTTDPYVKRFRRVPVADFVAAVQKWGAGVYVVGLDIHTGFVVNTGAEVYFIHSSYVEPYAVVREIARESKILTSSNYRVLGRVTADDLFIEKWLLKTEIVTRTS